MSPVLRTLVLASAVALPAPELVAQVAGTVPKPPAAPPKPAPRKPAAKPPAVARFVLDVEQDGSAVPIADGEAYLHRGPFTLIVESPQADGVYLSASRDRAVLDAARAGQALDESFRTDFVVAESSGNADQKLYVRPHAVHVLRTVDPRTLFFDSSTKVGAGFRARRTAARLADEGAETEIATAPARPLYLVLARGTPDGATGKIAITETRTLTLQFDRVSAAARERLAPHLKTLFTSSQPLAARAAALQELAKSPREAILVMDGGAQDSETKTKETAALARLKLLVSAERAYAAANGGLFEAPTCLAEPRRCNPKSNAAPLLQQPFEGEDDGYRRAFHMGTGITPQEAKKLKVAATSLRDFSATAVPLDPSSGLRALCADSSGRVCAAESAGAFEDLEGTCPAACQDLP